MATRIPSSPGDEPQIVRSLSHVSDVIIKEGNDSVSTVLEPGTELTQMCSHDSDVFAAFQSKTDPKQGGLIVFDATTMAVKQHIDTLALWSCAFDDDHLVAGGCNNGMRYIFERDHKDELHMVQAQQLHAADSGVYGVDVNVSIDAIISVGCDCKAIVSNIMSDVHDTIDLPNRGGCVVIDEKTSTAYVGCDGGSLVTIDLYNSNISSTIHTHGGDHIISIAICSQSNMLISSGADGHMIGWQFAPTGITPVWNHTCKGWATALRSHSDRICANVFNKTIAIDATTGKILKKYSKTGETYFGSYGLAIIEAPSWPRFKFED